MSILVVAILARPGRFASNPPLPVVTRALEDDNTSEAVNMSDINGVRRQSRLLARRTTANGDVHTTVTPPSVAKKGRKRRKKSRRISLMARLEQMLYGDDLRSYYPMRC